MLGLGRVSAWFASLDLSTRIAFVLAALPRVWFAFGDHSVFWPDEIYQSLEPAHRIAFGYSLLPWEFRDGARSWFFPGVLAPVLWLLNLSGVRAGLAFVVGARLFMVVLSMIGVGAAIEYARRLGGRSAEILAAVPLALLTPLLVFSHRTMQETASAPFVVLIPLLLLQRTPRVARLAGFLAGIASVLRFQCALIALVYLVGLLAQRRSAEARAYVVSGLVVGLAAGLLDFATWGTPFHSLITYIRFNLVRGGASTFGVSPPGYFLTNLVSSVGPMVWVLLAGFLLGAQRAWTSALACVLFVAAHSAIPHKEFRFLLPVLPLMLSVAGVGLARLFEKRRIPAWGPAALAAAIGLFCIQSSSSASYADLGQYEGTKRAVASPWNTEEEPNLLLADAGREPEVCGVMLLGVRAAFTGAYSYLHRQVPLLYRHQPCDEAKAANYLIAKANDKHVPEEFKLVRRRGQYALFRREGGCDAPPADHDDMLDGADDMGLTRAPVRQPDRRELRIKAGTSSAAFVQGFGNGEHVECRNARWATARVSTLAFELEPAGGAYEFSFAARPFWRTMPQSVQIALNGKRLEDFELEEGWESYQVPVPPSVLQRGRNVMEFRFARTAKPGTEDQRDLAVLFDQVVLTPVATEVSIDAGSPAARVNLGSGFSGDESDGARSYVWSNAERSELRFTLGGPSVPHVLQFEGAAYRPIAPLNVSVAVNGKPAGDVLVPARWTQSTLLLGAGLIQPGVNEISLAYQSTARPVDREPPAGDSRQLAVMYDRVKIAALPKSDLCDIGSPEARAQMLSGWSVDEREEERTFSWNDGGSSTLAIYSPDATDAARALKVTHQAFQAVVPVHVRVKVNGRFIGAFEASSRWETSELPIPGDQHWTGTALVEFSYDKSGRPSDSNPPSPDRRLLSVRFDRIELMEQVDQPDR